MTATPEGASQYPVNQVSLSVTDSRRRVSVVPSGDPSPSLRVTLRKDHLYRALSPARKLRNCLKRSNSCAFA